MIIDRIEEQERYYALHPLFEEAFAFLAEAPDLEAGHYELDDGLYANVLEFETKPMTEVPIEAHREYIDLHYCIAGGERMSWANIGELNAVSEEPDRDTYFYEGRATSVSVRPGMFYIMFPKDGHRPGCHKEFPKHCKKAVVKIPVNPC